MHLFKKLRKNELIITDCLHGAIIAAFLQVKCIAINTNNNKMMTISNWFNNLTYIKILNSHKDIESAWDQLKNIQVKYDNDKVLEKINRLIDIL